MNKIKTFDTFVNESKTNTLDTWKELMNKYDSSYYDEYQTLSKSKLVNIRTEWKALRNDALNKLNTELNDSGKPGQLMNIDVSDDALYPYLDDKDKPTFFKYSRILDFIDGYKPLKNKK